MLLCRCLIPRLPRRMGLLCSRRAILSSILALMINMGFFTSRHDRGNTCPVHYPAFAVLSKIAADSELRRRRALEIAVGVVSVCPAFWAHAVLAEPSSSGRTGADVTALSQEAIRAFEAEDFAAAEKAWRQAAKLGPNNPNVWSNLGVCQLIRAQELVRLDMPLSSEATTMLTDALDCLDRAVASGLSDDPVLQNQRGNVLGLLRRWQDALEAYTKAARVAPREFEPVARQNVALCLVELGNAQRAASEAASILRKSPEFIDARALLAAIRYEMGEEAAAETAWTAVCEGVRAPDATYPLARAVQGAGLALGISRYVPRAGGAPYCAAYSSIRAVQGRWPPRAVAAYAKFLKRRQDDSVVDSLSLGISLREALASVPSVLQGA